MKKIISRPVESIVIDWIRFFTAWAPDAETEKQPVGGEGFDPDVSDEIAALGMDTTIIVTTLRQNTEN
jgi:hypothetical protein